MIVLNNVLGLECHEHGTYTHKEIAGEVLQLEVVDLKDASNFSWQISLHLLLEVMATKLHHHLHGEVYQKGRELEFAVD